MAREYNPLVATLDGIRQMLGSGEGPPALPAQVRMDGLTALVTGANSGLGKAIALDCARRGARVIMACRGGIPEAGDEVARLSGSQRVDMESVDLSELRTIHALADRLRARGERLDRVVMNAGVMPRAARRTVDGLELMFQVNFLANVALTGRLLADGTVPSRTHGAERADAEAARPAGATARIVCVASESHRQVPPLEPRDWDRLGEFVDYGVRDGMKRYGYTKLLLITYARELARRLEDEAGVDVAVHSLCPGAVATNIAREAPRWVKPVLSPVMRRLFASPEVAARPVMRLVADPALQGRTGVYQHVAREVDPAPHAIDPAEGARLWQAAHALLARVDARHQGG